MRRNVLSGAALACTAVLATAVPAFADDPSPVPDTGATASADSGDQVSEDPSPVPAEPGAAEPTQAPAEEAGGVTVVPSGAPDTGDAPVAAQPGGDGLLIGGGAAAVLAAGGTAVLVVRRRASGA
ncbi:sortase-dependent protein [Streptomyces sp. NPDC093991]|uniref:sortase-dependent protein n=1 Tax=unclassified Streptomyces TaxID=2593676 RepID=UPI00342F8105